jgi:rod shape-determining protein MreC
MDSFFVRFKNSLVLIAIMVVQVVALALQVPRASGDLPGSHADGRKISTLRYWTFAVVSPFERLSHGSSLSVRHLWSNYIDLRHTREQNLELQQEIVRLRQEQEAFAEDAAQGRRLQALLGFQQQYISTTVAAQVIGTSGTDRSSAISIDKGYKDGLKSDQAVMTPDGVIGKVRDVWAHTAQVLLLNDAASGAGVVLSSSRIRGIVRGTANGQLLINDLTSDSRIKVGDQVVTSGGDKVFPRGLPVGQITSIVLDPQHQPYTVITVKPNANLSRLDEVLVITGTESELPRAAQIDAVQAEAAEQESRRAADLVGDKRPGLPQTFTNPNNPAALDNNVGGITGIPNSGLPRPKPPLHPDRYSPGAAPPATDLKPGAPNTTPQPQP